VQRQAQTFLQQDADALRMLPDWLGARWTAHYGEEDARALATTIRHEAPVDISIKDADASHEKGHLPAGETLIPGSVRVRQSASHITSWPGFETGAWWVQDIASSLPIRLLGDVAGKSVLDVCAAPGGKTMQLLAAGAKVTALDQAAARMTRLSENLARVFPDQAVTTVVADARTWQAGTHFDAIVLDAPCTSTGTLRRHPELPWIHSEKDIRKITMIQHDLLRRARDLLLPGGKLLYCTCSMEVEEGEDQLESFLKENRNFREIKEIPEEVQPLVRRGARDLGFRSYPPVLAEKGGMDGFFMAVLQKQ
jgi:16S rRNA (cytosine967-C5)-methyltransferase